MKNDMSVLNRILKTKQEEVTERKNRISERDLMSTLLAGRQRLSMRKALEESATGIIAEFKRKSPSGGFIHEAAGVQEVVGGYVRNGAAACSVLTDTDYFGGSLLDLAMARRVSDIPLLRKEALKVNEDNGNLGSMQNSSCVAGSSGNSGGPDTGNQDTTCTLPDKTGGVIDEPRYKRTVEQN